MFVILVYLSKTLELLSNISITRSVKCVQRYQNLIKSEAKSLSNQIEWIDILLACNYIERVARSYLPSNICINVNTILRMLSNYPKSKTSLELMVKYLDEELTSKLKLLTNKEMLTERTITQMILNSVLARKSDSVVKADMPPIPRLTLNDTYRQSSLSDLLKNVYDCNKQSEVVYKIKLNLRQKLYSLLSTKLKDNIDLFLIGSTLTSLASSCSDTDLCLVIYKYGTKVDTKYDERDAVLSKLEELNKILQSSGMSSNAQVVPALVPILKFIEPSTGIEVNINVNRLVTIKNTHLLHIYSLMDKRVAPLIIAIKLWAKKNGINSAYNKSLTSYSISLMVIHFLQSVCYPKVVPVLQKEFPHFFKKEAIDLRLNCDLDGLYYSHNNQSLGQLFIGFFEYYSCYFDYNKVISVRTGQLLDKELLIGRPVHSGNIWQWKSHICIEEPFIGTNTSHAVHNCQMFRQIVQTFINTYQQLIGGSFTP